MSDERIEKIKSALDAADHIPAEKKAALLTALSKLNPALAQVSETDREAADSIAHLVETSTHAATGEKNESEGIDEALGKLKQSVEKFEASHPHLFELVTEYSAALGSLGL